jgi:hypothetical protein
MRLARLAAVGLAIGVIAGFAIALLRPRPSASSGSTASAPPTEPFTVGSLVDPSPRAVADDHIWDQFRRADEAVELRSRRRVTG